MTTQMARLRKFEVIQIPLCPRGTHHAAAVPGRRRAAPVRARSGPNIGVCRVFAKFWPRAGAFRRLQLRIGAPGAIGGDSRRVFAGQSGSAGGTLAESPTKVAAIPSMLCGGVQ